MRFYAICLLLALSGCASQIMQSYVGKDVREAVLDYGPPVGALDLPDGQRAFQWQMNVTRAVPGYSSTTGNLNANTNFNYYSHSAVTTGNINSQTFSTPGYIVNDSCLYTLIAQKGKAKNSWIVTGFRKPRLECE